MLKIIEKLLKSTEPTWDELRIHDFDDDEEAHDDDLTEDLHEEFEEDFERLEKSITKKYGKPILTGDDDEGVEEALAKAVAHDVYAIDGIIRFAAWQIDQKMLFVTLSHADRGCPILMAAGSASAASSTKKKKK